VITIAFPLRAAEALPDLPRRSPAARRGVARAVPSPGAGTPAGRGAAPPPPGRTRARPYRARPQRARAAPDAMPAHRLSRGLSGCVGRL